MKHLSNILIVCVVIICGLYTMNVITTMTFKPQKHVRFNAEYNVYGRMSCPYTVKMVEELQNHNKSFRFIDTSTPIGETEFKHIVQTHKLKGFSVPYTINNNTHKSFMGYRKLS
jgi:glutaredoxin